ncbi:hypothetical protein [Salinisphaera hydrothermalis]|uniref:Uncharacterized protein n=1 Tax=Salinisphaera hydrothermalis (strain C41B8) TaxID=1304275 RepID=A0A084IIR3_SALHC|nr:hypothetical protein [Salinisphaera hydrothermalis]KEZ76597.1 hypothetical protein C41B8_14315 [Salinisphaera hydrothermalis C41B8]
MFERFRHPDHIDHTWHQFQCAVVDQTIDTLEPLGWRVKAGHGGTYQSVGGAEVRYVDIHVAEPRRGGLGFVIDAKHFKVAPLNRHELDSTDDYRRRMRAALAIVATSSTTSIPRSVWDQAAQMDRLLIMPVDRAYPRTLKKIARQLLGGRS